MLPGCMVSQNAGLPDVENVYISSKPGQPSLLNLACTTHVSNPLLFDYAISRCVNKRKKFKTRVALFDLQLKGGGGWSAFTQSNRRQQQGAKLHIISVDFF